LKEAVGDLTDAVQELTESNVPTEGEVQERNRQMEVMRDIRDDIRIIRDTFVQFVNDRGNDV